MQQAFGINIPQSLEDVVDAQHIALLVYDMQVGILSQLPNGAEVTARVAEVLDAARAAHVRIFFSRHLSLPTALMGRSQWRMAMAWQHVKTPDEAKPWFLRDTPGFEIVPALAPRADEGVFDKISMSAFEGTYLNMALRDCDINAFAVVGVATEIGIDPTVRHASDLGYIPIIIQDACGAGHADAAARSLDALAFAGDTMLTDTTTFCGLLQSRR